ncbi:neuronal calcium sensor 1-like [Tropilaelaps mercedesae]|uniref:Neuronal calcium sensor 1-like n=1 Tax=Tropilaelaps mercedesae TaxID=418985 RepID=A0A1V9XDV9_9ACAR|nr:neuronal calcium sensor 1-like [Tropilaelaps mercedesae]
MVPMQGHPFHRENVSPPPPRMLPYVSKPDICLGALKRDGPRVETVDACAFEPTSVAMSVAKRSMKTDSARHFATYRTVNTTENVRSDRHRANCVGVTTSAGLRIYESAGSDRSRWAQIGMTQTSGQLRATVLGHGNVGGVAFEQGGPLTTQALKRRWVPSNRRRTSQSGSVLGFAPLSRSDVCQFELHRMDLFVRPRRRNVTISQNVLPWRCGCSSRMDELSLFKPAHEGHQPSQLVVLDGGSRRQSQKANCWYSEFVRDCPNGEMTKDEFAKLYGQFFPPGDQTKFVDYIFNVFDEDKVSWLPGSIRNFAVSVAAYCRPGFGRKPHTIAPHFVTSGTRFTRDEKCNPLKDDVLDRFAKVPSSKNGVAEDASAPHFPQGTALSITDEGQTPSTAAEYAV